VEAKYQHTSDAWWQLRQLYIPVLQFMFPAFELIACEVTKWYDCAVAFPEPVSLSRTVHEADEGKFNVHIWKP